jgi:hypothetical protein
MEFYNTFKIQFELLPRLTIIYGKGQSDRIVFEDDTGKVTLEETEIIHNGFAIEWLWFGVFVII